MLPKTVKNVDANNSMSHFPSAGNSNTIYIDRFTGTPYFWYDSEYKVLDDRQYVRDSVREISWNNLRNRPFSDIGDTSILLKKIITTKKASGATINLMKEDNLSGDNLRRLTEESISSVYVTVQDITNELPKREFPADWSGISDIVFGNLWLMDKTKENTGELFVILGSSFYSDIWSFYSADYRSFPGVGTNEEVEIIISIKEPEIIKVDSKFLPLEGGYDKKILFYDFAGEFYGDSSKTIASVEHKLPLPDEYNYLPYGKDCIVTFDGKKYFLKIEGSAMEYIGDYNLRFDGAEIREIPFLITSSYFYAERGAHSIKLEILEPQKLSEEYVESENFKTVKTVSMPSVWTEEQWIEYSRYYNNGYDNKIIIVDGKHGLTGFSEATKGIVFYISDETDINNGYCEVHMLTNKGIVTYIKTPSSEGSYTTQPLPPVATSDDVGKVLSVVSVGDYGIPTLSWVEK